MASVTPSTWAQQEHTHLVRPGSCARQRQPRGHQVSPDMRGKRLPLAIPCTTPRLQRTPPGMTWNMLLAHAYVYSLPVGPRLACVMPSGPPRMLPHGTGAALGTCTARGTELLACM